MKGLELLDFRMNELSHISPSSIRLSKITFRNRKNESTGSMTGYAFVDELGGNQLEKFIEQLRSSMLFEKVQLLNVQTGRYEGREVQRFDVSFKQVGSPQKDLWNKHALELEGSKR